MTPAEKKKLQKEIVDSLKPRPHGRLLLAPRVGKTKLAIDLIKRDKPDSILWVTPSSKLAEEDIPAEFAKWGGKRYLKKLTTITYASLHKVSGHFEVIILDEEQYLTPNNVENLQKRIIDYNNIISMTGTATEHFVKQDIYRTLKLKVLYRMSITQAVNIGLLSNYIIKVLKIPMGTTNTMQAGNAKKRFMTSEAKNYAWVDSMAEKAIRSRNPVDIKFRILARLNAIKRSPSKLEAAKLLLSSLEGRKLIFCSTIAQSEELCENLYNSKTDNTALQKFMDGEIEEIAMVNSGGTGFTYKEIDHLVMVQVDSDKNGLTSQKICRTLLEQKNYKATIWILCLNGTKDEAWVESTLKSFDKNKVEYINY